MLNFVQKAVRLLWGGLDRVVNPHESVGRDLWRDVGPADLGEMAADVEMQKAFIGMKRPRSTNNLVGSAAGGEEEKRRHVADGGNDYGKGNNGIGAREERYSFQEQEEYVESDGRDRGNSLVAQMSALPGAPLQRPVATTMTVMTTPFEESKDGMSAPPGAAAQQQAIAVAEPMATAPTTTATAMRFEESNHNYNNDGRIMAEATSHSFPQEDYGRGRGNSLVAQLAVLPGAAGQQRFIAMAEPTTTATTTTAAMTMSEESKVDDSNNYNNNNDDGRIMAETTRISCPEEEYGGGRDQGKSLVAQLGVLPSLGPVTAAYLQPVAPTTTAEEPMAAPQVPERAAGVSINAPPAKGLAPAPILPHTVQGRPPDAQQFLFLDAGRDGHWAVQRAVTSLEDIRLWNRAENGTVNGTGADSGQVNNNLQGQYQNYLAAPGRQHSQQQHPPPTPSQPLHQEQPPKYQMSYVNYQPENAAVQQPQQQEHQPPVAVAMPYPPMGAHKDDPATIHANLMEFNAMARMHISNSNGNQPQHGSNLDGLQPQHAAAAPALVATPVAPDGGTTRAFDALNGTFMKVPPPPPPLPPLPPTLNGHPQAAPGGGGINLDRMVVMPISQSNGSVILTGPRQQMMYCTTSASAASQQLPGMGGTEGLRPIDPSLFALADRKVSFASAVACASVLLLLRTLICALVKRIEAHGAFLYPLASFRDAFRENEAVPHRGVQRPGRCQASVLRKTLRQPAVRARGMYQMRAGVSSAFSFVCVDDAWNRTGLTKSSPILILFHLEFQSHSILHCSWRRETLHISGMRQRCPRQVFLCCVSFLLPCLHSSIFFVSASLFITT